MKIRKINLGEISNYLSLEFNEYFDHVLGMYSIPYDAKIGIQEFQRTITKDSLDAEEFRTAKIISKVATNIRKSNQETVLVCHLTTLRNKSICDNNASEFDKSLLDSGYAPELLFGGKTCIDGKYTQNVGFSILTSDSNTILYAPIGIADEEIGTPILESLTQNKKRIISASGRLQSEALWSNINDVVMHMDNAHFAHYYAAAVEIQSMINKANYVVKDADDGKKMFLDAGLSERHLLDLYDVYMDYIDAWEQGDIVSHSMLFLSIPTTKITCDIYGEECTFFFMPTQDPENVEDAPYTTVFYDALPETSVVKYLTKLF